MDFSRDDDVEQVRKAVRQFVDKAATETDVRNAVETADGYDHGSWAVLTQQLGVVGLGLDEKLGGSGFGFTAVAAVAEELGAALHPSPFFASRVLALTALTTIEVNDPLVTALTSGEATACLALSSSPYAFTADAVSVVAVEREGQLELSGTVSFVVDGATASHILVVADHPDGPVLAVVEPGAQGIVREPLETVDLTRRQAHIVLDRAPARPCGAPGDALAAIAHVLNLAAIALAAEQIGGAQRCLDIAVEHAKTRIQFGRPIGSFQAIKHLCADVLLELDAARSAVHAAAWSVDHAPEDVPVLASMVKAHCSEMYQKAARACIQINGGMGFTWEHPAHLYFKRAHSSALMFGTPSYHREQLVSRLGVAGAAR